MEIIASIIPESFEDVQEKIGAIEGNLAWVQIDIVDGEFARPASWPYRENGLEALESLGDLEANVNFEFHLMVKNPEVVLDRFIDTPAKRIIIHAEASDNIASALAIIEMSHMEAGVCLNLETPIDVLKPIAELCDVVQLMSIKRIGVQGEQFDESVLEKVKALRKQYPKKTIAIDGGITGRVLERLSKIGVDRTAVGSAIFGQKDIPYAIETLKRMAL